MIDKDAQGVGKSRGREERKEVTTRHIRGVTIMRIFCPQITVLLGIRGGVGSDWPEGGIVVGGGWVGVR